MDRTCRESDLQQPSFYLYVALLLTLLVLGGLTLWMFFSDGREAKYAHRIVLLVLGAISLRDAYRLSRFAVTRSLGFAVFFGGLTLMLALFELVMTAFGRSSDEGLGLGFVAVGLPVGLVLVAGGWFAARLVAPIGTASHNSGAK